MAFVFINTNVSAEIILLYQEHSARWTGGFHCCPRHRVQSGMKHKGTSIASGFNRVEWSRPCLVYISMFWYNTIAHGSQMGCLILYILCYRSYHSLPFCIMIIDIIISYLNYVWESLSYMCGKVRTPNQCVQLINAYNWVRLKLRYGWWFKILASMPIENNLECLINIWVR